MQIRVSQGNMKLGGMLNFNLPPGESCSDRAQEECLLEGCYAMKAFRMYSQVRDAWRKNLKVCQEDLPTFIREMHEVLGGLKRGYFRIHSSGDFFSKDYFDAWLGLVEEFPDIRFMAYTKQFGVIHDKVPGNLRLFISEWKSEVSAWKGLPRARILWKGMRKEDVPGFLCPGSCQECKFCYDGHGDVVFKQH